MRHETQHARCTAVSSQVCPPTSPSVLPGVPLRRSAKESERPSECATPQRPSHKTTHTRTHEETSDHALHRILSSAQYHTRATARWVSFHFISFHFISFHFISFHFISFHFISFHFISFHFISFHFISFHFISFHFISFHFISFHFISFHFISFHFISFHSHTSLVSEVRAVAQCVRATPVNAHSYSALWGDCASESLGGAQQLLHPNPKGRHAPTAEGPHTHPHFLSCLSSTNLSGGRGQPKDPGAPLLSAVYVCPSPWQPPGSRAAKNRKTQRLPARMEKCMEHTAVKYMPQISPPGKVPRNQNVPRPKYKTALLHQRQLQRAVTVGGHTRKPDQDPSCRWHASPRTRRHSPTLHYEPSL